MTCLVSWALPQCRQHKYDFAHESSCTLLKMSSELILRSWVSRSKAMTFFFFFKAFDEYFRNPDTFLVFEAQSSLPAFCSTSLDARADHNSIYQGDLFTFYPHLDLTANPLSRGCSNPSSCLPGDLFMAGVW